MSKQSDIPKLKSKWAYAMSTKDRHATTFCMCQHGSREGATVKSRTLDCLNGRVVFTQEREFRSCVAARKYRLGSLVTPH